MAGVHVGFEEPSFPPLKRPPLLHLVLNDGPRQRIGSNLS
jgi:hypothetical protein